jgi:hypothetical protein
VSALVIAPPVFLIVSNGDLLAFSSVARAEGYVESIDVESGEYSAAFDATGQRLTLLVETPTKRECFGLMLEMTPVKLRAEPAIAEAALRTALVAALAAAGERLDESMSMSDLVARAAARFET